MDRLRHGGLPRLFGGVRAPSTLGPYLRLAALAYNVTRAVGALAFAFRAKAATATVRVPDQHAGPPGPFCPALTLHLPEHWSWADDLLQLFHLVHAPPLTA